MQAQVVRASQDRYSKQIELQKAQLQQQQQQLTLQLQQLQLQEQLKLKQQQKVFFATLQRTATYCSNNVTSTTVAT